MSDEDSPPYEFSSGGEHSPIKTKHKVPLKKVQIPGASLEDSPQCEYDKIRIQNTEQRASLRNELKDLHNQYKKQIGLVPDEQDTEGDAGPSDVRTTFVPSDFPKPLSRQASNRSRSDSPKQRRSRVVEKMAPGQSVRRAASSSPSRRDRSKESETSQDASPNKNKVGVKLNPRKKVKYTTSNGQEKERNMKRSHDDEFFWDTTVQPSDLNVRKTFNRAYLAPTVYNFSIDTHTPVAIVYIDPLDEKVYFAGAGECLDFISIPENKSVEWKPPNHPQRAFLSRDFCRDLPFNKFKKPKKEFKRQTLSQWKLSDLPVPTKNPQVGEENINVENDDHDEAVDENNLDAAVTDVIPVVKRSRATATRKVGKGRGGGRAGGQGGLSRGRGTPVSKRGSVDPQRGHTRGPRGVRNRVVAPQMSRPTFNPPRKESTEVENSDPGTLPVCSLIAEP